MPNIIEWPILRGLFKYLLPVFCPLASKNIFFSTCAWALEEKHTSPPAVVVHASYMHAANDVKCTTNGVGRNTTICFSVTLFYQPIKGLQLKCHCRPTNCSSGRCQVEYPERPVASQWDTKRSNNEKHQRMGFLPAASVALEIKWNENCHVI